MSCEHPNCSYSIHSICTNHCHWSLCQEHLYAHKNSLLLEFEEALDDLIKPTDDLSKSIEQMKTNMMTNQAKELQRLEQSHQKEIDRLEQQLIELNKYQTQFNQMSEHLIQIKHQKQILKHDDFQQLEFLSQEIHRYEHTLKDCSPIIPDRCPLTSLNTFGLLSSHHVRLCSPNKKPRNLFEHFRNHHHLTSHYANQLIDALRLQLDPMETKIFPPNTQIIVLEDKQPCSFYDRSEVNGIQSKSCATMVTKPFLPIHLKTVHRLRLPQIKVVLQLD